MTPTFTAKPTLFISAEGTGGIELVVGVCPDDAGPQLVHDLEDLAAFIGPDAGAQTIRSVVRALDCFFGRAESHDTQDRAKDFFLRDAMRRGDAGEEARRIPVAFRRQEIGRASCRERV